MTDESDNISRELRIRAVNLHIHTRYSDGILKPKALLEVAIRKQLDIISLTDHDAIDAYHHLPAHTFPVRILTGIEISSSWKGTDVHVLGYGIDIQNKELNDILAWMKDGRHARAVRMLDKLNELGIKIPVDTVLSYTGDTNLIVRPHIAQALVAANHCRTKQEAFEKFIGNDAPAYVPKPVLDTKDVINYIHKAGGIAVIAHPGKLRQLNYLEDFVKMGIDGVEVYHPDHREELINELEFFCLKNGLFQTGGSDYHGESYTNAELDAYPVSEYALHDINTIWRKYKTSR